MTILNDVSSFRINQARARAGAELLYDIQIIQRNMTENCMA